MAEVEGIDMVIVFADVEVSDLDSGAQSDVMSFVGPDSSLFGGSSLANGLPNFQSLLRSAEGNSNQRFRSFNGLSAEHRYSDISSSVDLSSPRPPVPSDATPNDRTGSEIPGGFFARYLSSRQSWAGSVGEISSGTPISEAPSGSRNIPPGLEQIIHRAFSHISGQSMMSEFMRRLVESQRRGNPPASRFAIENLEGSPCISCVPCAICQDEISKGCEAMHMPCKHPFHRECLIPWLQEHNTCPICRCEIESHCPRYNQSNFDKLKGPLQPVTVTNHENPSRMSEATPGNRGSHLRMTIRMPFAGGSLFDRTESSAVFDRPTASDVTGAPRSSGRVRAVSTRSSMRASSARLATSVRQRAGSPTSAEGAEAHGKRRQGEGEVVGQVSEDGKSGTGSSPEQHEKKKAKTERASTAAVVAGNLTVDGSEESPVSARTRTRGSHRSIDT